MRAPRASVIMPCYNHGRFVTDSALAILNQTFADLELIVIDDASKDDSPEIIRGLAQKDHRVKIILHEKNYGPSRSRNDGLQEARGEFVAFCDADDIWKPNKLARQIQILESHPEYDITYCDAEVIDEKGKLTGQLFSQRHPLPPLASGKLFEALCGTNFINTQTVLARRQPLGEGLTFNEHIRLAEDWWLWIALARSHQFFYESAALAYYRAHSQSTQATQAPGFIRSRCRLAIWMLRNYSDIPPRIRADLWYRIGRQLCFLGKRRQGCRFILKGVCCGWTSRLPARSFARMSLRWLIERSRQTLSRCV